MRSATYSLFAAVLLLGGLTLASCTKTPVGDGPHGAAAETAPLEASAPPPAGELISTTPSTSAVAPVGSSQPADVIARIRDEGMNRSQVMQTLSYLSDVIGPRLTGSPNLHRANE